MFMSVYFFIITYSSFMRITFGFSPNVEIAAMFDGALVRHVFSTIGNVSDFFFFILKIVAIASDVLMSLALCFTLVLPSM
jgi:hypothetical protein